MQVASKQQVSDAFQAHGISDAHANALAASGLSLGTLIGLVNTHGPSIISTLATNAPQILSVIQALSSGGLPLSSILQIVQEIANRVGPTNGAPPTTGV